MDSTRTPAKELRPAELIVLQGTSFCNLNCSYCDLSTESRKTRAIMPPAVIERFFTELFTSRRAARAIVVTWHSGEPLTLPVSYYEKSMGLILQLRDALGSGIAVTFDIQTNGVLIDEEWCRFFKQHEAIFNVGVSCDGPAELHDSYRRNWSGRETHAKTLRGMEMLEAAGVRYNLIAVVTRQTLAQSEAFYRFFFERREKISGFHFNILADAKVADAELSYTAADRAAYYKFFRQLLKLTRQPEDSDANFRIRNFSQGLGRILNAGAANAPHYMEETSAPLKILNVDAKGNITTFYAGLGVEVLPNLYGDGKGLSLGNIMETSLDQMAASEKLQRIMTDFDGSRQACAASCEYFAVCTGGFEIAKKLAFDSFEASETTECVIHVKTLVDALIDDIEDHLKRDAA